jgi:predicted GNAT family N-acyltransferase
LSEGLVFRVADPSERDRALHLRNFIYARELGHVPNDGLEDAAQHLIACNSSGQIVATFRILGPDHRPFDFETAYDLGPALSQGRRPAAIGRLCVHPDYRAIHQSLFIHVGLLNLAVDLATRSGFTDFFLYTFPHLLKFYTRVGFRPTGASFVHNGYQRLMHILHLELVARRSSPTPTITPGR